MNYIPYGKQSISENDIEEVIKVLKSDWLTQGPTINAFEKAVSDYCNAQYAVAVCNATAALHISCLALGLGTGDILWTSPNTFVASANCARYCGAIVDFVDIDPLTFNICSVKLEEKLYKARKDKRLPKIVIPVHFAGQSCEMNKIYELSKEFGFKIIEDASHAIGGSYLDCKVGSCQFSDISVFSFHPVKIITTGEGGIILTNNKNLYNKLIRLRTHGITRDSNIMHNKSSCSCYYEQHELGYNYRITDIQAALGMSQLKRIDEFIKRRHYLAKRYNSLLKGLPIKLQRQHDDSYSSYHLYVIRLELDKINKSHTEVFESLKNASIGVNIHYIPVHTHPYYRQLGFCPGDFKESEKYYREAITLPLYYGLTEEEQNYITNTLKGILI